MSDPVRHRLEAENAALRAELQRHGLGLPGGVAPEPSSAFVAAQIGTADTAATRIAAAGTVMTAFASTSVAPPETDRRELTVALEAPTEGAADERRPAPPVRSILSAAEKVRLFRSLFRGRDDVHAVRWDDRVKGTSGYMPARAWGRDAASAASADAPTDRDGRRCLPLTDGVVRRHLLGEHVVGLYPLDSRGRCRLVVADFDDGGWRDDAIAFARTAAAIDVPVLLEISRSGEGAHAWVFFDTLVAAVDARRLVTALLGRTCRERHLLALSSYDRLIPNQDEMPDGGFGSLVALPLQGPDAVARGASVFVDAALEPLGDPWSALAAVQRVPGEAIPELIRRVSEGEEGTFALDTDDDEGKAPWRLPRPVRIPADTLPDVIRLTLGDGLYIDRTGLPPALVTRFARLAAFPNPQWHENRRHHRSVWNVPMFIDKARSVPGHVWLPRGCLEAVVALVEAVGKGAAADEACAVRAGRPAAASRPQLVIHDERTVGTPIDVLFTGTLRTDQRQALAAMVRHDVGVLVAPPGFGKTVTAAALIAARATGTLVLVNRKDLLRQWRAHLATFLGLEPKAVGVLGGGLKERLTGRIDIAVVQALTRREDLAELVARYGQVVVDECHHVGAPSIDKVLAAARPRYLLGLTATPKRRDGLEPITAMQCGPVRHRVTGSGTRPTDLSVRFIPWDVVPDTAPEAHIQAVLSAVAADAGRTAMLAELAREVWEAGGKLLLLTERKSHLAALETALRTRGVEPLVLHGGLGGKRRDATLRALEALAPEARRCLLATGRLVGEGFDHPPLDTLVLAMPLSWRGTLEQYVGRLHRPSPGKRAVRVIDIDDSAHPMLASMRRKREAGYRALGYRREDGRQLF